MAWSSCESWTKKLVRFSVYDRIRTKLGDERFRQSRFLYLASGDGGDASVLSGLGIPAGQQMAVDYNPDALATFSERFPDVPTFCGDIGDIDGEFNVMFIDLYANVSNQRIAGSLARASRRLARVDDAIFVIALMQGRETKSTMMELVVRRSLRESESTIPQAEQKLQLCMEEMRSVRADWMLTLDEELASGTPESIRSVQNEIEHCDHMISECDRLLAQAKDVYRIRNRTVRLEAVFNDLSGALHARHIIPICDFNWGYQGNKVPMMVFGFRMKACPFKWSRSRFYREVNALHFNRDVDNQYFPRSHKLDILGALAKMPELPGSADRLLNVPRGTMAAYKAHVTRGTYATEAA